jgi:hypothetical protein
MKKFLLLTTLWVYIIAVFAGCTEKSQYQQMVERSLKSGETVNEIFLGYSFNTTREEFYEMSWQMNQQEIITGGVNIVYNLEELDSTVRLEFFPEFKDGLISEMPITASYIAWAPWNEGFSADNLLINMKDYYESVYETTFENVPVPDLEENAWVSIEGNREIRLYKKSVNTIQIRFIDLSKKD